MGAMRTHTLRITPKVHVLVHHVPEYVCRTGVARAFDIPSTSTGTVLSAIQTLGFTLSGP